jgi:hypothetical protein
MQDEDLGQCMESAGNSKSIHVDIELIPEVEHNHIFIQVHSRLQFFRCDSIDRKRLEKTLSLKVLVANVSRHDDRGEKQHGVSELRQVSSQAFELIAEHVAQRCIHTRPNDPTVSFQVPDVTFNSSVAVPFSIQARNVPPGTVVKLFISSENGGDQTVNSSPLQGTLQQSTGSASATLPPGYSTAWVKANWTQ